MGDHHDLAGRLLQGGGDDAGNDIRWTTRRIGHNEFHRAIRIGGMGRAHAQECRCGDAGR
jgi:hypothetical protein